MDFPSFLLAMSLTFSHPVGYKFQPGLFSLLRCWVTGLEWEPVMRQREVGAWEGRGFPAVWRYMGWILKNKDKVLFIFSWGSSYSFPSFISGCFLMLDLDKFQDIIHRIPGGRAGSCSITMFHFKLSQVKGKKKYDAMSLEFVCLLEERCWKSCFKGAVWELCPEAWIFSRA